MMLTSLLLQLACTPFDTTNPYARDEDGDGYSFLDGDCDGADPTRGLWATDADCDGVLQDQDCDDHDFSLGSREQDGDCDRALYAFDCDDSDAALGAQSQDADCDGAVTAEDCDDDDPQSTTFETDADCDTVLTADDCDDTDPHSTRVSLDQDCDGIPTYDDCNDSNPTSTTVATDADCDGTLTNADCDDADPRSTTVASDRDCDGARTADDCDDTNPSSTTVAVDRDCDGVLTPDDCDDGNPTAWTSFVTLDLAGAAYVVVPRTSSRSFNSSWSASIWAYRRSDAGAVLFSDGMSGRYCPSMALFLDGSTGRPAVQSFQGAGSETCYGTSFTSYGVARPTDVWTHTVVVVNGGSVRFYQDGTLTANSAISATDPYTPIRDLWLGREANLPDIFNGAVSDLAFWTRALTASEATTIYTYNPGSVTSGLVGWWPMDDGGGATVHEASGMANDGTINGAAVWNSRCGPR